MEISIRNYRPDIQGSRVGFIDIRFASPALELFGCSIHQQGDKRWIGLPFKTYVKPGGWKGKNYMAKFHIPEDYQAFCDAVFTELDRQLEKSEQVNALREFRNARA